MKRTRPPRSPEQISELEPYRLERVVEGRDHGFKQDFRTQRTRTVLFPANNLHGRRIAHHGKQAAPGCDGIEKGLWQYRH